MLAKGSGRGTVAIVTELMWRFRSSGGEGVNW
jgi:hypothetical protein